MLLIENAAQEGLTQRRLEVCHVWQAESTAVTLTCTCLCRNLGQEEEAMCQMLETIRHIAQLMNNTKSTTHTLHHL